jgi:hypothetical protein
MRVLVLALVMVGACAPPSEPSARPPQHGAPDNGPVAPLPDAGPSVSDAGPPSNSFDAGLPPDGGLSYSPGPTPASDQQSGLWAPTGAAGCEGLVPARVPPRLAWSPPAGSGCWWLTPTVDGQGDLAADFYKQVMTPGARTFFPAGGGAGLQVADTDSEKQSGLIPRPQGFYTKIYTSSGPFYDHSPWVRALGADGSNQGVVGPFDVVPIPEVWPDPRGGYVQLHMWCSGCSANPATFTKTLALRWVDAELKPRTSWWPVTTWSYGDFDTQVFVDALGNALVLVKKVYPMSMPCGGADTLAFWVTESGSVVPFAPATPTYRSLDCSDPQFAGFGSAVTLDDGFAFHQRSDAWGATSPSGWYAHYPSGSGTNTASPPWLLDHDGSLQRLAGRSAYLGTRRDRATCARTAEIVGPAGQVCATLGLDGSAGCDAIDRVFPDGTLVLQDSHSCSLRWWPGLGRSR